MPILAKNNYFKKNKKFTYTTKSTLLLAKHDKLYTLEDKIRVCY